MSAPDRMGKSEARRVETPFFSICIPHYNRTRHLLEVCKSLASQTFRDFEVCISDDDSTDGRQRALLAYLSASTLAYVYQRQERNLRYDGNLRASIALSRGRYCFLLGNDDSLSSSGALARLHEELERVGPVGAAITNFEEFDSGRRVRRVRGTRLLGSGVGAAAANFRNVAFVSGVVLDGSRARGLATARWDGSEMYQMYLFCRIVGEGLPLLGLDEVLVRKDVAIPGEVVDSYARRPRLEACPIVERRHTLHLLGRIVMDGLSPTLGAGERRNTAERVLRQVLLFTYPYWIVEYRRIQSNRYALGICLGMRPRNLAEGLDLSWGSMLRLRLLYAIVTLAGFVVPIRAFRLLYPRLHRLSKSRVAGVVSGFGRIPAVTRQRA